MKQLIIISAVALGLSACTVHEKEVATAAVAGAVVCHILC